MDILVVVDMQNDFVTGVLGTKEAEEIVPRVAERVLQGFTKGETVLFTRDTHDETYLDTQEGKNLPVPHCIRDTEGWEIVKELQDFTRNAKLINKPTFGSAQLGNALMIANQKDPIEKITLIGLCTDICVISNAMLLKAFLPEAEIVVDASCCAGVTPEAHTNALEAMKSCQIVIENQ